MIRTKFQTESFDELFELCDEFEQKLVKWQEENTHVTWDIQILVGEQEHTIIVTVEEDENKETE